MERNYKKKYEFQKDIISRQQKQIEELKSQIVKLENECKEKDEIIHSIEHLRFEFVRHIDDLKKQKDEYQSLVEEVRNMRDVMNEITFKKKWKIIRFLMK